ncbi:MAG: Crp/Fnr family transcriptional regulator [Gemmatimonadales bacterium]
MALAKPATSGSSTLGEPQSPNHLLAVVEATEFQLLRPHLTAVELRSKQVLCEENRPIPAIYFPHNAVISVVALTQGDEAVEVGSIGCEGMLGLPVLLGSESSITRAIVQIGGTADRMDAAVLAREVTRHASLRRALNLYAHGYITQISQSTACNRLHSAEQRLARWLLICCDRTGSNDLAMTHEIMAIMLGVRRATVTETAGMLQRRGMIRYRRGLVSVLDRAGLEATACECYDIVRKEFERLLGVRVG